jgi:urease accessory protein
VKGDFEIFSPPVVLNNAMPLLLTTKLDRHHHSSTEIQTDRLSLTAEDRVRSRHPFVTESGREVYVQLKRGTQLQGGDRLQSEDQSLIVEIVAKPEQVMAVTTAQVLDLLEAAYHLGNRHVPLEIYYPIPFCGICSISGA